MRSAWQRSLQCALSVGLLAGLGAGARAQQLVTDAPVAQPGGTAYVGKWTATSVFSAGPTFHFTAPVTITSIAYDPGVGGARELAVRSLYGCSYNQVTAAGTICGIETEIASQYPGWRYGTLRVTTTTGVFTIPVEWQSVGAQVVVAPGLLTRPPVSATGNALAVDAQGNIYLSNSDSVVRKIDGTTGKISIVAGVLNNPANDGDGGPATAAHIQYPLDVAASPAGDVYVVSSFPFSNDPIRKVDGGTGTISTVGGIFTGRVPTLGNSTDQGSDGAVTVDDQGNVYATITHLNALAVTPSNGSGTKYLVGSFPGVSTGCNADFAGTPSSLAVSNGFVYFSTAAAVYKISTDASACHAPVLVAGTGTAGNSGDGGLATQAAIGQVSGLSIDAAGDLYLADATSGTLRLVSAASGTITTIAGAESALPGISIAGGYSSIGLDVRGNLFVLGNGGVLQELTMWAGAANFADTAVGQTSSDSPKSLIFTNIGNDALSAANSLPTMSSSDFVFDTSLTSCGTGNATSLAAGASCVAGVAFKPTTTGPLRGSVALGGTTVSLSGSGTAAAVATTVNVSPSTINFGTVTQGGKSGVWTVNIANTGANTLNLQTVELSPTKDFTLVNGCGATVAAHRSCNFTVQFTPQAAGTISATVIIGDNAGSGVQNVQLTGVSTSDAPVISISPGSIDFGAVTVNGKSAVWNVSVSNTGGSELDISSIKLDNNAGFQLVGGFVSGSTCAKIVAYGSCQFSVQFLPTAPVTYNANIQILSNGQSSTTNAPKLSVVSLAGTGVAPTAPTVSISPANINFGSVSQGNTSGTWTVWVGNTSAAVLNLSSVALNDTKNFVMSSNCGASVAAYSSCNVTLQFKPQTTGTITGTVTLTDNASTGTQTITLTGRATKASYAVTVNPSELTLQQGQSGTAQFVFAPAGGFTGAVNFACAGLPAGATCSFAPATLTGDGTDKEQVSQLTVTTQKDASPLAQNTVSGKGFAFASLAGFNGMLLMWLKLRRKGAMSLKLMGVLLLLSLGVAGATGCGSGGAIHSFEPAATSTVRVVSTSMSDGSTQTATFQLIVK